MAQVNSPFLVGNIFNVKYKVALITGGGTGIGLLATQALAVNGAKVYIVGRRREKLEAAVKEHGQNIAGQIIPITADITSKSEIAKLVNEIESREKHLDVLINNAGISGNYLDTGGKTAEELKKNYFDAESSNVEDWVDTYRANVPHIFFMMMAFLPLLQKATTHQEGYSGVVINISSIAGIVKTPQHHFAYNASKAAVVYLNKLLAAHIVDSGLQVRVNSIAPGLFPTEMTTGGDRDGPNGHISKERFEQIPEGRPGKHQDMASAVLFMVTNQYVNGQTVAVDGGYILHAGA